MVRYGSVRVQAAECTGHWRAVKHAFDRPYPLGAGWHAARDKGEGYMRPPRSGCTPHMMVRGLPPTCSTEFKIFTSKKPKIIYTHPLNLRGNVCPFLDGPLVGHSSVVVFWLAVYFLRLEPPTEDPGFASTKLGLWLCHSIQKKRAYGNSEIRCRCQLVRY